jgi:diamine N-acetyltransferase
LNLFKVLIPQAIKQISGNRSKMQLLESKMLRLRAPEPSDLDLLYIWENDTTTWLSGMTLTPFSKFVLTKYLETAHLDVFETKQLRLMIDLKTNDPRTIGTIDIFDFDSFNNRAGIGILIADPTDRCKGYATDALLLLHEYCFKILGLNQLYCNIAAENSSSIKLFQKCGYEVVGLKKRWTRRGNNYVDEYLLQLLNPVMKS